MQTKQLATILRMILVTALTGLTLEACGGQVADSTGQTNPGDLGGSAGAGAAAGFSGGGTGGIVSAGAGGSAAGSGGPAAGAGGVAEGGAGGSVAGAGGVAEGGGGAGGDASQDFHALSCDDILKGLALELGFDSIEIWQGEASEATEGESSIGWMKVASDGVACNTPEKSTCGDVLFSAANSPLLTGLSPYTDGGKIPRYERVISTKGGLVTSASAEPALLAMLGNKIDTDAKLLVWLRYSFAFGVPCDLEVRQVGDHFEVKATVVINDCPSTTEEQTLAVNADGTLVVLVHGVQVKGGSCP